MKANNNEVIVKAPVNKTGFKRIGILCSGGNAPGMANCVNSFTKNCLSKGITPIGFSNGFTGLYENRYFILDPKFTQQYVNDGSALIGTSRCPKFASDAKYREKCVQNLQALGVDALFVVGGEGSYKGAYELSKLGVKVITIPATIDNDVASTSYTIGFDTCLNKVCNVVNDITDVFVSHQGVALIEIMGRSCPDLTVRSGIANNATYIVSKYSKLTPDGFVDVVKKAFARGKFFCSFLVTEKLYGIGNAMSLKDIAKKIEKETGLMTRHIEVGYMQRGGSPSARDRLLANYMINIGLDALIAGRYNRAVCRRNRATLDLDLGKALKMKRRNWNRQLTAQFNKINQE